MVTVPVLTHTISIFWETTFQPLGGAAPSNFYTALPLPLPQFDLECLRNRSRYHNLEKHMIIDQLQLLPRWAKKTW